jgi:hypothetical protein
LPLGIVTVPQSITPFGSAAADAIPLAAAPAIIAQRPSRTVQFIVPPG